LAGAVVVAGGVADPVTLVAGGLILLGGGLILAYESLHDCAPASPIKIPAVHWVDPVRTMSLLFLEVKPWWLNGAGYGTGPREPFQLFEGVCMCPLLAMMAAFPGAVVIDFCAVGNSGPTACSRQWCDFEFIDDPRFSLQCEWLPL
jgi:hypothetical protein